MFDASSFSLTKKEGRQFLEQLEDRLINACITEKFMKEKFYETPLVCTASADSSLQRGGRKSGK